MHIVYTASVEVFVLVPGRRHPMVSERYPKGVETGMCRSRKRPCDDNAIRPGLQHRAGKGAAPTAVAVRDPREKRRVRGFKPASTMNVTVRRPVICSEASHVRSSTPASRPTL